MLAPDGPGRGEGGRRVRISLKMYEGLPSPFSTLFQSTRRETPTGTPKVSSRRAPHSNIKCGNILSQNCTQESATFKQCLNRRLFINIYVLYKNVHVYQCLCWIAKIQQTWFRKKCEKTSLQEITKRKRFKFEYCMHRDTKKWRTREERGGGWNIAHHL